MKNDKQKYIVLGALGVVIIGVGAFQVVSSNSAPPPAPVKEAKAETSTSEGSENTAVKSLSAEYASDQGDEDIAENSETTAKDPMQQLYSMNLGTRDPFDTIVALPITDPAAAKANPGPKTTSGSNWKGGPTMPVPPFDPMQGSLPTVGNAPNGQMPPMNLAPQGPAYSVAGVIHGEKSAAVISDAQGNQRLVKEGQAIDGDARVISVQKNKVVIRKQDGKTITLKVGGNP